MNSSLNRTMIIQVCNDYVMFDIETTGLSSDTDAIIELSALKVINHEVVDEFSTLINPGIHIPYYASSINGITDDMVKDSPSVKNALKDFELFIGNSVLAGHNIKRFDLKFVQRDAVRHLGKPFLNDFLDTLIVARRYLPDLDSHSLEALADYYDISYEGAHRALADCHINKKVYDFLIKEMENPSAAALKVKVCPLCGNVMRKRNGAYGEFWGCCSYPDCRYTENI